MQYNIVYSSLRFGMKFILGIMNSINMAFVENML